MKNNLTFQKMLAEVPLQVLRMADFSHRTSFVPHRHNFYMLLWTTKGRGAHRINYREYELLPGRLFFTHEGQTHQMMAYPEDGWMILFQPVVFREFLNHYKQQEQAGLFDFFNRTPYVLLDKDTSQTFVKLIELFSKEAEKHPFGKVCIHYLSALLIKANNLAQPDEQGTIKWFQSDQLRRLKGLIENHYKTHRDTLFYSQSLGMSSRKLNDLTKKTMGKLVQQIISDRLLSESELLLGGTNILMKEIIHELCFIDHAHFAYFFKKQKEMTPSAFRKRMQGLRKTTANSL